MTEVERLCHHRRVRVLIATTANDGHFGPLTALTRAFAADGDEVAVAAPASFSETVRRAGFAHLPFADAPPELIGPIMGRLPSLSFDEADTTVIREVFGRVDAQAALPGLVAAIDEWRPDVVVREPAEFGSLAAAERAGVPHVHVTIGMLEMSRHLLDLATEPLAELAVLGGLPRHRLVAAAAAEPVFSLVPETLDRAGDADYDGSSVTFRFRDEPGDDAAEPLPSWGDRHDPLVYVTFGTVAGSLPPFVGVFREALDGLADLPVRVLMTVGRRFDIAGLGTLPPNASVLPWWPQRAILAEAAVVWGHGGFGTTMGAAAAAVPQLITPLFTSDQRINARHLAAAGAGLAFGPGPDALTEACGALPGLLGDAGTHAAAAQLAADIAALPAPATAAGAIRQLIF